MAKPRIISPCVAERHNSNGNERIAEFSAGPNATGGLLSVRSYGDKVVAELYRLDDSVVVRTDPDRLDLSDSDIARFMRRHMTPEQKAAADLLAQLREMVRLFAPMHTIDQTATGPVDQTFGGMAISRARDAIARAEDRGDA